MKKTVLGSFIFCALNSWAYADSSVTIYGIVDAGLSFSRINGNDVRDASNVGLSYGAQSGNRVGLKGIEDLGDGNKLSFMLENGFDLGNGTLEQDRRLFGRQAWFGLENDNWGYARIGRQYNFATDYFGAIDPFKLGFGQASMGAAFGSANMDRMSNAIKFQTPDLSGFQVGMGYSFAVGEPSFYYNQRVVPNAIGSTGYNYATANNVRQLTLGAKYASGPFYLAASFDKLFGTNEPLNESEANPTAWNIGASYDFNIVKFALAYGQSRDGQIRGGGDGMTGANEFFNPYWGTGNNGILEFNRRIRLDSYLVGLTIPFNSASRVFSSWTFMRQDISEVNASNQSAYSIGYSFDFTKRINMYAFLSYMTNVNTQSNNSAVLGVGMRHIF